jgi:hypothetical protein
MRVDLGRLTAGAISMNRLQIPRSGIIRANAPACGTTRPDPEVRDDPD